MSIWFSLTAAMGLHAYAARFAEAGLTALVFDHASYGASPGEPRNHTNWEQQCPRVSWLRVAESLFEDASYAKHC